MTEQKFHCQICARDIKAKTGVISHHGYQRPGGGWQTGSCPGARHLPYEKSRDAIPPVLESIKNHRSFLEARKRKLENRELPAKCRAYDSLTCKMVDVDMPEDASEIKIQNAYNRMIAEVQREMNHLLNDINHLQERYNAWEDLVVRSS